MLKMFSAVLCLLVLSNTSRADLYDERAKAAREAAAQQAQQEEYNRCFGILSSSTAQFNRLMSGFINSHRGIAGEGICTVQMIDVSRNWGCVGWRDGQTVAVNALEGQAVRVQSCRVELGDGLACVVGTQLAEKAPYSVIGLNASCYGPDKVERQIFYPGSQTPAKKTNRVK